MPHKLIVNLAGALALAMAAPAAIPWPPAVRYTPRNGAASDVASGRTSTNWSGYAAARGPYTQISASWVVPAPGATAGPSYSSTWIGIDGFDNTSLIQVGTEQDYVARARYYAWWEILPSAESRIGGLAVAGGDRMTASITRAAGGAWTISLLDRTSGQSFAITQTYSGPLGSAEWMVEAPNVGSRPAELARYGQTSMESLQANGTSPGLTRRDAGMMIQNGRQVSTPSAPNVAGNRFAIAYGSQAPPTSLP
jgi:hypothetical protein